MRTRLQLYISGDTLVHDRLKEIPRRYPGIDLALLHLGGTKILGVLMVTMDAGQGVEAIRIIEPRTVIPIHYNDYTVFKSPLEDFKRAVAEAGLEYALSYAGIPSTSLPIPLPSSMCLRAVAVSSSEKVSSITGRRPCSA